MNKEKLQLGTCRGMVALVYHQIEAYAENEPCDNIIFLQVLPN